MSADESRRVPRDQLCAPCRAAADAWLDYRVPARLSITYGSGAAYDATPRGIADARAARFTHWRETIRWHRQHITELCLTGRHAEPLAAPPIPALPPGETGQ